MSPIIDVHHVRIEVKDNCNGCCPKKEKPLVDLPEIDDKDVQKPQDKKHSCNIV